MSRTIPITLTVVVLAYVGLCAALFIFQRSLIYFPQPKSITYGSDTLSLPIAEGQVLVSTIGTDENRAVIYFGGNAEDVSGSIPGLTEAFPDRKIFLMHYRGYGGSSGEPSEAALFADALALHDEITRTHQDVIVIGRSLGSGIAIYTASKRPTTRLILVTPYDSLQEIAAARFPFMPVRWLLNDKYESWKYAPNVKAPTLIIAAEHDEIIQRESSELLRTRFEPQLVSYSVISGTNHNNISFSPEYLPLLSDQ